MVNIEKIFALGILPKQCVKYQFSYCSTDDVVFSVHINFSGQDGQLSWQLLQLSLLDSLSDSKGLSSRLFNKAPNWLLLIFLRRENAIPLNMRPVMFV